MKDVDILRMDDLEDDNKKVKKLYGGIKTDSLLRETSSHYIRMIGDADRKARIMLIVNSILLTAGLTIISNVINKYPLVWISATLLIAANLISLFFSILSVKPELHDNHIAKETENNMLHYKKCSEYSLGEYTRLMMQTMGDEDKKMDAIIKDLYYYGNLLAMKYKLMRLGYRFFFYGIMAAVISYLIILLATH